MVNRPVTVLHYSTVPSLLLTVVGHSVLTRFPYVDVSLQLEDSSDAQAAIEALLGIKLTQGIKQVSNEDSLKEGCTQSPQQVIGESV